MVYSLQKKIIRICQPISSMADKIPSIIKKIAFYICINLIIIQSWLISGGVLEQRYLTTYTIGCLLLATCVFCTMPIVMKERTIQPFVTYIFVALGLSIIIMEVINGRVDNIPEGVLITIAFPIIYFIWENYGFIKVINLLVNAVCINFVIYFITCCFFFPIEASEPYAGLFENVNVTAFYLTLVFCSIMVQINFSLDKLKKQIIYIIMASICFILILYTSSRTGILACICGFIVYTLLKIISLRKTQRNIKKFLLCISIIIICIIALTPIILNVINLDLDTTENDRENNIEGIMDSNINKLQSEGKTLSQYSSGRIDIWKEYLNEINFSGHDPDYRFFVEARGTYNSTAHMTCLQVAYDSGVISGILYLIFNIVAGVIAVIRYIKEPTNDIWLTIILFSISFGVISMVASVGMSYIYIITLFYYLMQTPLFYKPGDE